MGDKSPKSKQKDKKHDADKKARDKAVVDARNVPREPATPGKRRT